jgi:hypothetical protein
MGESNQKKGFQFVDRRRFDSSGVERDVGPVQIIPVVEGSEGSGGESRVSETTGAADKESQKASRKEEEFRPEASSNPEDEVTLTSFIMSLATQTMVQLGEMDPPVGMEIPIDVESARHTIEIISMLQRRTKSTLSADESRFIVEVLHTLRMSYVRKSKQ